MADNLSILEPDAFYGKSNDVADTESIDESATDENITEEIDETPAEEVVEVEAEESEETEDNEDENSEKEEVLYIDLDGEEVSLDQIKEWKSNGLMQADYTRKTQTLADDRKLLETDTSLLSTALEEVRNLTAELEAEITSEDEVDMEKLREDDLEEYVERKERKEKRDAILAKSKKSLAVTEGVSKEDVAAEQSKLIEIYPEWVSDGKATDAYKSDMNALDNYLKANDWSTEEFSKVYQSKHMQALIKAAKFDALKIKTKQISEKRKKAPVVKKGQSKSTKKTETKNMEDIFYK